VWIAARREAEGMMVAAEVTGAGGRGRYIMCDAADEQDVAGALRTVGEVSGRLDGVVHNATSGLSAVAHPFGSTTLDEVEDHVRVSVRGLFLLARESRPFLRASRGSLVVTTSEAGFEGKADRSVYAMVKAAQRGLVRVLAREWGPDGIRVNCIGPLAATPAMERAFLQDPAMAERVLERVPLGRLGHSTDDIGALVSFLLSDEARYVTGQTVMVDGGSGPIC
jgi:3-oxoacyl-[acyl-carrier protein] reductase